MKEIITDIIIPIITSFIGAFLGGITYNSYKYNKELKSNKMTGDNYEYKNRE